MNDITLNVFLNFSSVYCVWGLPWWLSGKKYHLWCRRLPEMQETWVRSLGQEDPLEKEITTHSSIPAWEIPWTEGPGGLQSMESQTSWTWLWDFTFTFHFHALEMEMATESSILHLSFSLGKKRILIWLHWKES